VVVPAASLLICPQSFCCFSASCAAAFLCVRHPFVIKKIQQIQQPHLIYNLISNHFSAVVVFLFHSYLCIKSCRNAFGHRHAHLMDFSDLRRMPLNIVKMLQAI